MVVQGLPSRRLYKVKITNVVIGQYIRLASKKHVRLTGECEELLRSYFRVMRTKGSQLDTNELSSVSTMSTLLKLATCHAKATTTDDALVSIMMVEESMAARFVDLVTPASGSMVPTIDHNEYRIDTEASMMDAKVPFSVEDERDCTMKRMHAHLMRVIVENFV
ncbi:hypothetical protein BGX34_005994 [Mortierella sp. NVP85]|nr:hypothetical protein BGX34_005994 [Mortierella sp. NVP85]